MKYLYQKLPQICSTCRKHLPVLSSFMIYHRVCNQINTTSRTESRNCASFWSTRVHTRFQWGSCYSIFSFMCNVLQIVVCPVLFFLPLCCLSFDLRILITPLVSSNSSYIETLHFDYLNYDCVKWQQDKDEQQDNRMRC